MDIEGQNHQGYLFWDKISPLTEGITGHLENTKNVGAHAVASSSLSYWPNGRPNDADEDEMDLYIGIDDEFLPTKGFGDYLPIPFYDESMDIMALFDSFQSSSEDQSEALGSTSIGSSSNACVVNRSTPEFEGFGENPSTFEDFCALSSPPLLNQKENLIELLVKCAEALSENRHGLLGLMVARLDGFSSPHGDPLERLCYYATDALRRHSSMTGLTSCNEQILDGNQSLAYDIASQSFVKFLPYQKFLHFSSNQAILEALGNGSYVHIIDLGTRQGFQWPSFMQALSVRQGGPPKLLKITAIGSQKRKLKKTGKRLSEFARVMGIPFSFHPLIADFKTLDDKALSRLRIKAQEILVVNCSVVLNKLLSKSGRIHGLFGLLRKLNPAILTVMEIESNQNMPSVVGRFLQCLELNKAVFSSVDAAMERDHPDRELIERLFLAPNIGNVLSSESENSLRYACMDSWRKFLRHSNFKEIPLSHYNQCQASLLLASYSDEFYKVEQDGCAMTLSWKGTPIVSVSAWTC